jgi:hypothetical protein
MGMVVGNGQVIDGAIPYGHGPGHGPGHGFCTQYSWIACIH